MVLRVKLLTLNSKHLVCLIRVFFAEYDSGVTLKKDKLRGVTPSKILVDHLSWLKRLIKYLSEGTPFKITVLSSLGLHKEAKCRIINKV